MRIRIIKPSGNYVPDAEFDTDDQVGQELCAQGIARIVEVVRAADVVRVGERDHVFAHGVAQTVETIETHGALVGTGEHGPLPQELREVIKDAHPAGGKKLKPKK